MGFVVEAENTDSVIVWPRANCGTVGLKWQCNINCHLF